MTHARSLDPLSISQIYPPLTGRVNLNTCSDPDCPNYGTALDPDLLERRGGSKELRETILSNDAVARGLGRYKLHGGANAIDQRVTSIFEHFHDPVVWYDNRTFQCQHARGNTECSVRQKVLSNKHFDDEVLRLCNMNGLLDGPSCGACGKHYLEVPHEFAFDGANGKSVAGAKGSRKSGKPVGIRIVHKPCRGKRGARFTVSAEHSRQQDRRDNLRIFTELVNNPA